MAETKSTKAIAQRIDPTYFRKRHWLRRTRGRLSLGLFVAAAAWMGTDLGLGRQGVFSSGPVSLAHRFVEADCAKCHVERFGAVQDAACIGCHDAGPHIPAASARTEPACGACHREHAGSALLDAVNDRHCNGCHEAHRSITSLDSHIQFARTPRDQALRFDHAAHLKPDLQQGPLHCGSCHRMVREGVDFLPIRFEVHCAPCHRERVAPDIEGTVPHGLQPEELRDFVAALFARQGLGGEAQAAGVVPGRGTQPPAWAVTLQERTDRAVAALLQPGRGCLLCHVMEGEAIHPPEIPAHWFSRARFDHRTHRFIGSCDHCHDMKKNTDAMTLELPGVENCRRCHGPRSAPDTCTTCHPYHPR